MVKKQDEWNAQYLSEHERYINTLVISITSISLIMGVLVASETSCESGSVFSHSLLMLILRQVFSEMTEGVVITITST